MNIPPANHAIDDLLIPFADLVQELVGDHDPCFDPTSGQEMSIARIKLTLPVELRVVVTDDGTVQLKGSPPTQRTETTIMPIFHRLQLEVISTDDL
jgi:hypothetical protein